MEVILDTLKDIVWYREWEKVELINKGWSPDRKFRITDKSGRSLLLRVADITEYDKKKREYERLIHLSKLGLNMSMPVDFGVFDRGKKVFTLLTWIDGEDALEVLPKLTVKHQYLLGKQAGEILRKIHSLTVPGSQESWGERYRQKIQRVSENYHNCPIKIEDDHRIIQFIENNLAYLDERPITFQHGDFHVGNLIVTAGGEIGVIDFNRSSFGDPWEEYDRYVFTWRESIPFAVGQIQGYFDNNVPDRFFRLMSLYNAVHIIASIPWAVPFGNADINTMLKNGKLIYDCYNGFETYIPGWYKQK